MFCLPEFRLLILTNRLEAVFHNKTRWLRKACHINRWNSEQCFLEMGKVMKWKSRLLDLHEVPQTNGWTILKSNSGCNFLWADFQTLSQQTLYLLLFIGLSMSLQYIFLAALSYCAKIYFEYFFPCTDTWGLCQWKTLSLRLNPATAFTERARQRANR